ncbi:phosphonopyruvate decarboxylase [Rhizobium rhizogenes]|uniref:phosphonopyruvate decarboxylase n=1 Tax=Rhizobium rhizogenes TaxID=359 RepID=UPI00115F65BA|nr:phosphonopyruvate decarboxylase [Rhizobium rhizogenes]QCL10418.1 phosphonopyruvate decarboxylase [Rhizobium rhizogenes]QCO89386.1 phosphonopyruvate decarboxylase [Rhizobium rhizogenes]TRB17068.1 phosphonopyruvate decarboxylase [Rhizobium rhizogenes]
MLNHSITSRQINTRLNAETFIRLLKERSIGFFTGVPCSYLMPLSNAILSDQDSAYVGASSEAEAIAIAAGSWLTGRGAAVLIQNSGLGNAVNPLTSLTAIFRIPILLVCTWRGEPGQPDEPQHEVMGRITHDLLQLMGVPHKPFPASLAEAESLIGQAGDWMATHRLPFAFVLKKNDLPEVALNVTAAPEPKPGVIEDHRTGTASCARYEILESFLGLVAENTVVVSTTGKCSRELFTLHDDDRHLYQVGSMGCASGMGLGIALNSSAETVVIDGDGALLMKLGSLATNGAMQPRNLHHIVLDNRSYDSTGGQPTSAHAVDFALAAHACGYHFAARCDDRAGFEAAFHRARFVGGPSLIHVRIKPGSMERLGRPTVKPPDVASRFRTALQSIQNRVADNG